jgi:hypothetical protein
MQDGVKGRLSDSLLFPSVVRIRALHCEPPSLPHYAVDVHGTVTPHSTAERERERERESTERRAWDKQEGFLCCGRWLSD